MNISADAAPAKIREKIVQIAQRSLRCAQGETHVRNVALLALADCPADYAINPPTRLPTDTMALACRVDP